MYYKGYDEKQELGFHDKTTYVYDSIAELAEDKRLFEHYYEIEPVEKPHKKELGQYKVKGFDIVRELTIEEVVDVDYSGTVSYLLAKKHLHRMPLSTLQQRVLQWGSIHLCKCFRAHIEGADKALITKAITEKIYLELSELKRLRTSYLRQLQKIDEDMDVLLTYFKAEVEQQYE